MKQGIYVCQKSIEGFTKGVKYDFQKDSETHFLVVDDDNDFVTISKFAVYKFFKYHEVDYNRKEGYYWLRLNENSKWHIFYWSEVLNHFINNGETYKECLIEEINEQRIKRPNEVNDK